MWAIRATTASATKTPIHAPRGEADDHAQTDHQRQEGARDPPEAPGGGEEHGQHHAYRQGLAQVDAEGGGAGEDGCGAAHALHERGLPEEVLLDGLSADQGGGHQPRRRPCARRQQGFAATLA